MKTLFLVICVFFSIYGFCQNSEYQVISLYAEKALLTDRYMPFKVYSSTDQAMDIKAVVSSDGCLGMVDPYNKKIALVYCMEPTTTSLTFFLNNGKSVLVSGVEVKKLSILNIEEPDISIDPKFEAGKLLYNNNCIGCHSSKPSVSNIGSLKKSFLKINQMKAMVGKFTDSELEEIIIYIKGGGS